MADTEERKHYYHAEATALTGSLHIPLVHIIHPQASAKLPEKGGYVGQQVGAFHVESAVSYKAAHTQVAGNREKKPGHGFGTLVTSVVEGLNVLDVVTCDKVVAQVATDHPVWGHVPSITFLGTRFENLRIAGHEVKLEWNLDLFGPKPDDDAAYTQNPEFVQRVTAQHALMREERPVHESLLKEFLERYNLVPENFENSSGSEENVVCSLVTKAEGFFPGHCAGHVIQVPDFGTIHLAVIRFKHWDFQKEKRIPESTRVDLTMIEIDMGCVGTGNLQVGATILNGGGRPVVPPPTPPTQLPLQ